MTDINIPPEAVEAAVRAYASGPWHLTQEQAIAAALRAGIAAWPGMMPVSEVFTAGGDFYRPHLILPLPTENTNAED